MIGRREFIGLLGGAAVWPLAARAQQPSRKVRIAYIAPVPARNALTDVFEQTLRRKGWLPGQNITIEYRYTQGRQDTIAPIVAELADLKLDAILAWSPPVALAVKRAIQVPLVFLITCDPVEVGLVSNLSRPEGHVTGLTSLTSLASLEIIGKRLQLLRETVPAAQRIAVLLSTEQIRSSGGKEALDTAAKGLGMELQDLNVAAPSDLDPALRKARTQGADALPKYELLINLKTAKALGLEIPPTLLARADEVIE